MVLKIKNIWKLNFLKKFREFLKGKKYFYEIRLLYSESLKALNIHTRINKYMET